MSEQPVVKSTTAAIGLSKCSPHTQIAVGASSGFLIAFVTFKVSKVLAIFAGGTILVVQLAVEADIIKIEWKKDFIQYALEFDIRDIQVIERARSPSDLFQISFVKKIRNVVSLSLRLYVSFLGGFLLGYGFA